MEPEHDPHIAKIKDLAAAAVLAASLGALIVAALIFIPHLLAPLSTFDNAAEQFLYSLRTPGLIRAFLLITNLGGPIIVGAIALLAAGGLWVLKRRRDAIAFAVTLFGSAATTGALKIIIARPRPGGLLPIISETSASFPSGHATLSMALYGFLAYLAWRHFKTASARAAALVIGALLILSVGFSRLYLGVHFPTDVIAGWGVGAVWIFVGIAMCRRSKA
jgi:membrane-associated phospholipid phosphatase